MFKILNIVIVILVSLLKNGRTQTYYEVKDALPDRPQYGGVMGKYLSYPGVRYEPNVPSEKDLVYFTKGLVSTYQVHLDHMNSVLSKYDNEHQQSEQKIDCESLSKYRPSKDWDKTCRFDLINLGGDCVKQLNFGFDDGMPCIFLSLDRILNWLPEPYTSETVPDKIRDDWSMYAVTVHCEGEDPVSKDNIGNIYNYPQEGFHFRYFPYTGQTDWISPLVAVQLANPVPGIAIRVTCSVYTTNIKHYDKLNTGKVSFDVMVD